MICLLKPRASVRSSQQAHFRGCTDSMSHAIGHSHCRLSSSDISASYSSTSQPRDYRVTVSFLTLQLQEDDLCRFDFVQIHDGGSLNSPAIGNRYCNTSQPLIVRSSQNVMLIRFKTDAFITNRGFNVTYYAAIIPQEFILVATSRVGIYRVDIETFGFSKVPVSGTQLTLGIGYDPVEDRIYWTEAIFKQIRSAFLNGSDDRVLRTLNSTATPFGIAVDSQSGLVFYTDIGNRVIALITISTLEHKLLITSDLEQPRAVVLDSDNGVLYWTDLGTRSKIERANFDSSERRTIVNTSLVQPNGITLDAANNRLYWVDGWNDNLEWSDTEGKTRGTIFKSPINNYFFGVALYNNQFFVTDWTSARENTQLSFLYWINKDGSEVIMLLQTEDRFNGIHIYSAIEYRKGTNACRANNGGCRESICIPYPGNQTKCLYPDQSTGSLSQATVSISSRTVVIKGSSPFQTDGTYNLTLTCDPDNVTFAVDFLWNITCDLKVNNTCTFLPQPPEDDGKTIMCLAGNENSQSAMGLFVLQLNYPPPSPPVINGYQPGQVLQAGSSLTMTCTVKGGKPTVDAVIFSCLRNRYLDVPDIYGQTEVLSILTINPIKANDGGETCICRGVWKNETLYRDHDTRTLVVNGTDVIESGPENYVVAVAGGVAGAAFVVAIIFIVLIISVQKKRREKMRGYPPSNNEQTNDYQTSGDSFETDSDVYNEITDTPDISSDTNYDDDAILVRGAPDYLQPISNTCDLQFPIVQDDDSVTKHDYLHPKSSSDVQPTASINNSDNRGEGDPVRVTRDYLKPIYSGHDLQPGVDHDDASVKSGYLNPIEGSASQLSTLSNDDSVRQDYLHPMPQIATLSNGEKCAPDYLHPM